MIASCLPLHGKPYILLPYFTCKAEDQHLQNKHTLPHIQWQTNTISSYRIQHGKRPQNQHIHFHTSMENYKNTLFHTFIILQKYTYQSSK